MEKKVKIKIISRMYDLQENDRMEQYISEHPDYSEDDISTKLEVSVHGTLSERDGELSLSYCEPANGGMGKTVTRLSFALDAPKTVVLDREGEVRSHFVFDESAPRSTYFYETSLVPFEMSVATKRLVNRIGPRGGTLHLDYKIDMHGRNMERAVLDIMVREVRP